MIMKASDAFTLISSADYVLSKHIEKLPAKQKKTAKSVLESVVKLAYVLYVTDDKRSASQIVDAISEIPFANSYDYWTWVESALILKRKIAAVSGDKEHYEAALETALAALKTGTDLQVTVKTNVHKRFLEGQTLDPDFEEETDVVCEFEMRIIYIMALLKIEFFGGSETWPTSSAAEEVAKSGDKVNEIMAATGMYNLPPYK